MPTLKTYENLHKNVNENNHVFIHIFYAIFHGSVTANFARIFMKFQPKCRTKKLGMIYTILGSFAHFLIGKWSIFGPKSALGKSLHMGMLDA